MNMKSLKHLLCQFVQLFLHSADFFCGNLYQLSTYRLFSMLFHRLNFFRGLIPKQLIDSVLTVYYKKNIYLNHSLMIQKKKTVFQLQQKEFHRLLSLYSHLSQSIDPLQQLNSTHYWDFQNWGHFCIDYIVQQEIILILFVFPN